MFTKEKGKVPLMIDAQVGAFTRSEGCPLSHNKHLFNLQFLVSFGDDIEGVGGVDGVGGVLGVGEQGAEEGCAGRASRGIERRKGGISDCELIEEGEGMKDEPKPNEEGGGS